MWAEFTIALALIVAGATGLGILFARGLLALFGLLGKWVRSLRPFSRSPKQRRDEPHEPPAEPSAYFPPTVVESAAQPPQPLSGYFPSSLSSDW